jgi:hypothetical protein
MIYRTVRYRNLTFDPDEILRPKQFAGVVPAAWSLHVCDIPYCPTLVFEQKLIVRWLDATFVGRWSLIPNYSTDKLQVIIAFEVDTDAAMFVLLDGHQHLLKLTRRDATV